MRPYKLFFIAPFVLILILAGSMPGETKASEQIQFPQEIKTPVPVEETQELLPALEAVPEAAPESTPAEEVVSEPVVPAEKEKKSEPAISTQFDTAENKPADRQDVTQEQNTPSISPQVFKSKGRLEANGYVYKWYSCNEPGLGGATAYPINGGRQLGADGIFRDIEGYVCVAANRNTLGKFSLVPTPFGMGKVYDTGCNRGVIDIYTEW